MADTSGLWDNLADRGLRDYRKTAKLEYTLKGGGKPSGGAHDGEAHARRRRQTRPVFLCTEHDIHPMENGPRAALREKRGALPGDHPEFVGHHLSLVNEKGNPDLRKPPAVKPDTGFIRPGIFHRPFTHGKWFHPDDLAHVGRGPLEEIVLSGGKGLPTEFRCRHADGSWVYLEALGSNQLRNPSIRGIIVTARDITERKRTEEALRVGEERFRLITENTKEVIWMMDMNLGFTYINPYIEHNLGYTPEEYLKKQLTEVMTPASVELCMLIFAEELENERKGVLPPLRSRTIEVEHIHKNGTIVWAEIKMTFIRKRLRSGRGHPGIYPRHRRDQEKRSGAAEPRGAPAARREDGGPGDHGRRRGPMTSTMSWGFLSAIRSSS